MKQVTHQNKIRARRQKRARAKIYGTREKPRVAVFRSNTAIYAQIIDDTQGKTLAAVSSRESAKGAKMNKTQQAEAAGEALSKKAKASGVTKAVFDRRSYKYHGRVKALADGIRKGGIAI